MAMRQERPAAIGLVVDLSPIGLTRCSADLRYVSANPAYGRMAGLDVASIVGRRIVDVMGENAFATIRPHIEKVLRGKTVSYEAELDWAAGSKTWHRVTYVPDIDEAGKVVGWIASVIDITAQKTAELDLAKRDAELLADRDALSRLAEATSRLWQATDLVQGLDAALQATVELMGADMGNIQLLDPVRQTLKIVAHTGFDDDFLQFFADVSAADDSACGRALRSGERIVVIDVSTDERLAWMRDIARAAGFRAVQSTPVLDSAGAPLAMISTHFREPHQPQPQELRRLDLYARAIGDFIQRCRFERERDVLLGELNHRVNNTLATVLSIAGLSLGEQPPDEGRRAFELRIKALARTHRRLTANHWAGASLGALVRDEIKPYASDSLHNVEISGPELSLGPKAAVTLCLALHELATNAARHGALSSRAGRVSVEWSLTADGGLSLGWTESGGPAVSPPTESGFGRLLLERGVAADLGAAVRLDFAPDGVRYAAAIPQRAFAAQTTPTRAAEIPALRVMIVEDDFLLAHALSLDLQAFGFRTLGPFLHLQDALQAADDLTFDVALLDINLNGETCVPVAEKLAAMGTPFVFLTGYNDASLPPQLRSAPVLTKPYESEVLRRTLSDVVRLAASGDGDRRALAGQ
jgi:PAS domain S-box-containing protein